MLGSEWDAVNIHVLNLSDVLLQSCCFIIFHLDSIQRRNISVMATRRIVNTYVDIDLPKDRDSDKSKGADKAKGLNKSSGAAVRKRDPYTWPIPYGICRRHSGGRWKQDFRRWHFSHCAIQGL